VTAGNRSRGEEPTPPEARSPVLLLAFAPGRLGPDPCGLPTAPVAAALVDPEAPRLLLHAVVDDPALPIPVAAALAAGLPAGLLERRGVHPWILAREIGRRVAGAEAVAVPDPATARAWRRLLDRVARETRDRPPGFEDVAGICLSAAEVPVLAIPEALEARAWGPRGCVLGELPGSDGSDSGRPRSPSPQSAAAAALAAWRAARERKDDPWPRSRLRQLRRSGQLGLMRRPDELRPIREDALWDPAVPLPPRLGRASLRAAGWLEPRPAEFAPDDPIDWSTPALAEACAMASAWADMVLRPPDRAGLEAAAEALARDCPAVPDAGHGIGCWPRGWAPLWIRLVRRLQDLLAPGTPAAAWARDALAWRQVKEKFGRPTIYWSLGGRPGDDRGDQAVPGSAEISRAVAAAIDAARDETPCQACGRPGMPVGRGGWVRSVCDAHLRWHPRLDDA